MTGRGRGWEFGEGEDPSECPVKEMNKVAVWVRVDGLKVGGNGSPRADQRSKSPLSTSIIACVSRPALTVASPAPRWTPSRAAAPRCSWPATRATWTRFACCCTPRPAWRPRMMTETRRSTTRRLGELCGVVQPGEDPRANRSHRGNGGRRGAVGQLGFSSRRYGLAGSCRMP